MAHSFEEVRQIASELPVDQRILLANSLWESVDRGESDATEAEVDAAWDGEIGRRVAEIKAGSAVTCSLEEVEADLRVEGDALVLRKPRAAPRIGWAEASIKLAALGDDALVLPGFANNGDAKLAW
jgi:antitoxin MazE